MSSVITKILSGIKENDKNKVEDLLYRLPIISLNKETVDEILGIFLSECEKNQNKEFVITIISLFDEIRSRIDAIPILVDLINNSNLNKKIISFCFDCFSEKAHYEYYFDLLNIRDHSLTLELANKLASYFNDITLDRWQFLYKEACKCEEEDEDEEINECLKKFFETKIKENKLGVSKHEWIKSFEKQTIIEIPKYIPHVNDAVDLLIKDIKNKKVTNSKGKDIDVREDISIKEMLISQYAISTVFEKIQMLEPIVKLDKFDDSSIFREFGPVNTIYTLCPQHLDQDHICVKYGGCRMLLCREFEEMNYDGEPIDIMSNDDCYDTIDWFRGKCDICLNKIAKRHLSIRQPLYHGGWKGCYCSFECMITDIDQEDTYISLMIGRVKEQLNTIGIRDR